MRAIAAAAALAIFFWVRKTPPQPAQLLPEADGYLYLDLRPDDPDVLLCLGRLCRREQLWGKAEANLARAIGRGAGADD